MTDIDLGFPEEREVAWLTNRYFPSKLGGRPAWLELSALPEKLQCGKCKGPLSFLCQIYAPYDDEFNFHRTLFVFICRSNVCQVANSAENLVVLRSQLPLKNDFYSEQPPAEEGDPLPEISTPRSLCLACGAVGPLACARCRRANYCSAPHQRAHWPHHKKVCIAESKGGVENVEPIPRLPQVLFPEWEIVMEPNDAEAAATTTKITENSEAADAEEERRLSEYKKLAAEGKTGELQDVPDSELDKYAQNAEEVDDKHFRKFKKEVNKAAEQIIRYKRGGQPLWIADAARTFTQGQLQVPKCEHCGGVRQFELQLMPQMLLLLKDEQLDWGVLAIYTCARSCQPAAGGYLKEYIVKQDIILDNSDEK